MHGYLTQANNLILLVGVHETHYTVSRWRLGISVSDLTVYFFFPFNFALHVLGLPYGNGLLQKQQGSK